MHGTIFMELRKYVETKLGKGEWRKLLDEVGLGTRLYLPIEDYPDQEAISLMTAASRMTRTPADAMLEDFGEFIAPDLIKLFGYLVNPEWKTIDLIANTEQAIHQVLRDTTSKVTPPELKCTRPSPGEVIITYTSQRKLCAMAKGIAKGFAKHYHERIQITEPTCMLKGAPKCEIRVKLAP